MNRLNNKVCVITGAGSGIGKATAEMFAHEGATVVVTDIRAEAADQVRSVLRGEPGAKLDMVLLNAGAALLAAGKVDSIKDGITEARELVNAGAALKKLEQLVSFSSSAAEK